MYIASLKKMLKCLNFLLIQNSWMTSILLMAEKDEFVRMHDIMNTNTYFQDQNVQPTQIKIALFVSTKLIDSHFQ